MGKTLILTEKPSVAREFAAALGVKGSGKNYIEDDNYVITWCVGHLVKMSYPEKYDAKYKKWNFKDLPFLPEEYKYEVIYSVKEQYQAVTSLMHRKDIDTMLYCGDAGREGEVIGRLIRNYGGIRPGIVEKRVWIDSQTKEEILRGIREAKPLSEYDKLADSGILRGIEDYAFGLNFTRGLSCLHGKRFNQIVPTDGFKPITVGRVMTCVLGMVVRREREIENFKETVYYKINGSFDGVEAEWKCDEKSAYHGFPKLFKDIGFLEQEDAEKFVSVYAPKSPSIISFMEVKDTKKKAPLLYNLAELQNDCARMFRISPDDTLKVVQKLYEAKLVTYPRTDARVLSSAIAKEIKHNLSGLENLSFCKPFVSAILGGSAYKSIASTQYTNDAKITDHYAIIPTGNTTTYNKLNDLERAMYELIVKRFLAIFYPAATYTQAKISFTVDTEQFHVTESVLKDAGYLEVSGGEEKKKENKLLPFIKSHKQGDEVPIDFLEVAEGKTTPPKRYNSGALILAMENAGQLIEDEELRAQIKGSGIGTSATRAGIIKKLVDIEHLNLNKKTQILTPSAVGFAVYENIPSLLRGKGRCSCHCRDQILSDQQ